MGTLSGVREREWLQKQDRLGPSGPSRFPAAAGAPGWHLSRRLEPPESLPVHAMNLTLARVLG